jgi:hypothetical protein
MFMRQLVSRPGLRFSFWISGMIDLIKAMRTIEQTTQEILELATKHFKAAPGAL